MQYYIMILTVNFPSPAVHLPRFMTAGAATVDSLAFAYLESLPYPSDCSICSQVECWHQGITHFQRIASFSLMGFSGPTKPAGSIFKGIWEMDKCYIRHFLLVIIIQHHPYKLFIVSDPNITSVSSQTWKLYLCRTSTRATFTNTCANRIPRQLRGPIPNGR